MRKLIVVLAIAFCATAPAFAQVSVAIGFPGVSIGLNLPVYPDLVRVPGYPVYYAPRVSSNYFFYDGMYWVYQDDNWYASSWYNGPWGLVAPDVVPLYVLRVPVRYYRRPPPYFHAWYADGPPRWGEHWGGSWEQSHRGWDHWNRSAVPAPAPLPVYQRQYSGARYPQFQQQQVLQSQNYRYQPRDRVVQQHYQAQRAQMAPAPSQPQQHRVDPRPPSQQVAPAASHPTRQQQPQGNATYEQQAPRPQGQAPRPAVVQAAPQQPSPTVQRQRQQASQPEQQTPRAQGQAPKPAVAQAPPHQGNPGNAQHGQSAPGGAGSREQGSGKPQGHGGDKGAQGKPGQDGSHGEQHGKEASR